MNRMLGPALSRTPAPSFALLILLSGCGDGTSRAWAGTVVDSAGIPVVMNPDQGLWAADEGWTLEEDLSIGGQSPDPEYQFGQVAGMDVDGVGNIYIADLQAAELKVFDAGGRHLRTFGTRGEGPGELGQVGGVFVAGEELRVPDLGNRRVNLYTLEGESTGSFPIDLARGVPVRWDEGADDQLLVQLRGIAAADQPQATAGDRVVAVGPDGEIGATILRLPIGEALQIIEGRGAVRKILAPEPLWDAADDGRVIWGVNSQYRIEIRNTSGETQSVVAREFERRPFTERDQEVFIGALEDVIAQQGATQAQADQFFANLSFAEFYPNFVIPLAGPDGTLWVQRIRTGNDIAGEDAAEFDPQDLGSNEWEVFDGDGRYLGVVEFPPRFQPIRTIGDHFYGIARDELDVQSVKAFRVVR